MSSRRSRNSGYLVLWFLGVMVIVTALLVLNRPYDLQGAAIRGLAIFGYLAVFSSILSTAYLRQLVRFFGRSFVKVHHVAAISGLIAITLHPIVVAFGYGAGFLLPQFGSLRIFLQWGGSVAYILLAIAASAARVRKGIPAFWRAVHNLAFLAYVMATVHAALIGSDGTQTVVRIALVIMALIVVFVFVQKRREGAVRRQRAASR